MNKDNQYQDFIDDHDKYVDLIRFLKLNKITGIRKAEKHSHELHGVFLEGWPETTFREYEDTVHRYFYRKRNDMARCCFGNCDNESLRHLPARQNTLHLMPPGR